MHHCSNLSTLTLFGFAAAAISSSMLCNPDNFSVKFPGILAATPTRSYGSPSVDLGSTVASTYSLYAGLTCTSSDFHLLAPTFKLGIAISNLHDFSKLHNKYSFTQKLGKNSQNSNYFEGLKPKAKVFDVEEERPANAEIRRKNLAVFVSGGGSNFRSIHDATCCGSVHGAIVVLITNKPGCGGAAYARENGIPVLVFPKIKDAKEGLSAEALVIALRSYNVDFILLAGYLKLIPAELIQAYPKSIVNIHPSLLPAFGGKGYHGMKVHQAVIASGARFSGPTIHFVDEQYDTGRILAQRVVEVLANDTAEALARRVLNEEHKLYVEVTSALCEERIIWREDGVPIIRSKENPYQYR